MREKILATITTYNPEIGLLEKNIDAIIGQVDKLLVYENASKNRDEVLRLCEEKGAEVICNDKNYGVAGPLHDGVEYAYENGYVYILTLDQDSVASESMVEKLAAPMRGDDNIAIVAANPIPASDASTGGAECESRYVDSVYTSGMLADVAKIKKIGNYIPEMFIDWVDNEICYRAKEYGYGVLQSGVPIIHRLGESQKRWFLWRYVFVQHYSQLRYYYIYRNGYYCAKRYSDIKNVVKGYKRYLHSCLLKVVFYERNKIQKLKAMHKGHRDGKKFLEEMQRKYALTEIMGFNIQKR